MKGTVKFFNDRKGYGFINPDGEKTDIFVHYTGICQTSGRKTLKNGQRVSFITEQGKNGTQACDVVVI